VIAAYGAVLLAIIGAVAGGSDNSGYFNEALLLSKGTMHAPMRVLPGFPRESAPYLYVPLGFKPAPGGSATLVPTYPPGLPLLLAAASALTGWTQAGNAVLIVHALAGLLLLYALGRRCGLPEYWALGGTLMLAASPLYLFLSVQALSDVPAATWATAAVLLALESRGSARLALASGACVAVGFLIRPSNFLVAIPVFVALGASPRRIAYGALGAIPGFVAWALINHAAYGAYLESGYGAIGAEFHSSLVGGTLGFYLHWLPLLLGPAILPAPALLFMKGVTRRIAFVLTAWAVVFLAFYSAYRWTHEDWWFLRFVLPAAPAMLIAGLGVVHKATGVARHRHLPLATMVPALLLGVALLVEASQTKPFRQAWEIGSGERKYGRVADWVRSNLPANSVLVVSQASGALFYFTDFTLVRSDQIGAALADPVRRTVRSSGRPVYAVLFPFERDFVRTAPGAWEQVGAVDDVTVWKGDWSDGVR
jgi:4-amino-4-deoxy-L-arabinose transferase-like glycosyltransferase